MIAFTATVTAHAQTDQPSIEPGENLVEVPARSAVGPGGQFAARSPSVFVILDINVPLLGDPGRSWSGIMHLGADLQAVGNLADTRLALITQVLVSGSSR